MTRGSAPKDTHRAPPFAKRRRAVPLADLIGDALTPSARKRGFASAAILTHWDSIVDAETALTALPERLIWPRRRAGDEEAGGGATLVVATNGASAMVLQHTAPLLIDRLNTFFGWRAVERLKIVQRPIPVREAPPPPPPPLSAEDEAALAERLAALEDSPLKVALERLGRAVLSARPARTEDGG